METIGIALAFVGAALAVGLACSGQELRLNEKERRQHDGLK